MYKMGSDEKRTGLVFYLLSIAGVWFFWDLKTCAILLIPLVAKFVPLFHGTFWSGLAKISFSLYLTHFLVGQRVLNFGRPYADSDTGKVALFGAALLISLGIAYVFYRLIEQPSHRFARKIAQT